MTARSSDQNYVPELTTDIITKEIPSSTYLRKVEIEWLQPKSNMKFRKCRKRDQNGGVTDQPMRAS